jgi:hypothetical protein
MYFENTRHRSLQSTCQVAYQQCNVPKDKYQTSARQTYSLRHVFSSGIRPLQQ